MSVRPQLSKFHFIEAHEQTQNKLPTPKFMFEHFNIIIGWDTLRKKKENLSNG